MPQTIKSKVVARPTSYSAGIVAKKAVIYVVCTFLSIMSIFPFWVTFVNSTRSSYEIQQKFSLLPGGMLKTNFLDLVQKGSFSVWQGMFNSFVIATLATIICIYFATLTAYGFTVYKFKGNDSLFKFVLAILMIPTQVSAIGFFQLMYKLKLVNTYIPLIVPAIAAPATVFFMRQYMKTALPLEIVEAARIDGAGEFQTFNIIGIPMMKPALATQAIMVFIGTWNNFFTPAMILSNVKKYTLPIMVQMLKSDRFRTNFGLVYLGIAMSILPLIIVYICLSKYIIQGVALGGVKE